MDAVAAGRRIPRSLQGTICIVRAYSGKLRGWPVNNFLLYQTTYDLGEENNEKGSIKRWKVNSDFDTGFVYVLLELLHRLAKCFPSGSNRNALKIKVSVDEPHVHLQLQHREHPTPAPPCHLLNSSNHPSQRPLYVPASFNWQD